MTQPRREDTERFSVSEDVVNFTTSDDVENLSTSPEVEDVVRLTTSDDVLLDTRGRRQPRKKQRAVVSDFL